jgi:transposase
MGRIKIYFPPPHGVKRVDDKRVLSGIIYVLKNGLRWCAIPPKKNMAHIKHSTIVLSVGARWECLTAFFEHWFYTTAKAKQS